MTTLIVTTGPESSGKTTLATQLASSLAAPVVPEIARAYLTAKLSANPHFQYQEEDLLAIAQQQVAAETKALEAADQWVVCDTDLLVIMIWSEVKYGHCSVPLQALFERSQLQPRHYLLCTPEMAWEPDPLRENPHDRAALLTRYEQRLEQYQLSHQLLRGNPQTRLYQALAHWLD